MIWTVAVGVVDVSFGPPTSTGNDRPRLLNSTPRTAGSSIDSKQVRVWDHIFLDGWAAVYRVALARLSLAQQALLDCELDEVGKHLRDRNRLVFACGSPGPQ